MNTKSYSPDTQTRKQYLIKTEVQNNNKKPKLRKYSEKEV